MSGAAPRITAPAKPSDSNQGIGLANLAASIGAFNRTSVMSKVVRLSVQLTTQ